MQSLVLLGQGELSLIDIGSTARLIICKIHCWNRLLESLLEKK